MWRPVLPAEDNVRKATGRVYHGVTLLTLVCFEFNRVMGKNLQENFFDALYRFSPRLMDLYRKKKGVTGQLLRQTKGVTDKDLYSQTPVGILCTDQEHPQLNPSRVGIILERNVVMDELANLPQAFCLLFGLTYALHLDYPKYMKNTFYFIQQVMLNLGKSELAPKIQT